MGKLFKYPNLKKKKKSEVGGVVTIERKHTELNCPPAHMYNSHYV